MGNLFKTKTFWVGVGSIVAGVGLCITGDFASGIQTIILGMVSITGRDAVQKMSNKSAALAASVATASLVQGAQTQSDIQDLSDKVDQVEQGK